MKKNSKHPKSASKKEDLTTKKNDELGEDELNKVTGSGEPIFVPGGIQSWSLPTGAGKIVIQGG